MSTRQWMLTLGRGAALMCVSLLMACSGDKPKPAVLDAISPKIAGRQVWQAKLTGVQFPLVVASRDGVFTVAGDDGTVLAFEAASGRELWRAHVAGALSAGVGTDGRFTTVVTRTNEVVTLEQGRVVFEVLKQLASFGISEDGGLLLRTNDGRMMTAKRGA
ncbi:MAG: PQQ-binding-like beta-propeller repeat protein [Roseimicrobium sp.]